MPSETIVYCLANVWTTYGFIGDKLLAMLNSIRFGGPYFASNQISYKDPKRVPRPHDRKTMLQVTN